MKARSVGSVFVTTIAAAVVLLAAMAIYANNVLDGRLANHVLSSRMFGVPEALQRHGFEAYYQGPRETGWDGQFYYYIANDPLARRDTVAHVDSDAYRYQRIGLPAVAWVTSRLFGRDWVSPTMYFATNLGIVLLATFIGALHFIRRGRRPAVVLLWTFSLGVVLTVLNGLPDAAADAFLLIALVFYLEQRRVAYAVFATLAALSREAYILFPAVIALFDWLRYADIDATAWRDAVRRREAIACTGRWLLERLWIPAIPGLIFVAWQTFIRIRFGRSPSSQAIDILGLPFASFARYLQFALTTGNPLFPEGYPQVREVIALVLFAVLLLAGTVVALVAWRRGGRDGAETPIAAATLLLAALYACFGGTVMMHYTGYMKASGVFFVVIPLSWNLIEPRSRAVLVLLLAVVDAFFLAYLWADRIDVHAGYDRYLNGSHVTESAPKACLKSFDARLALVGIEDPRADSLVNHFAGDRAEVFKVAVTNDTTTPFTATNAAGAVNVSYHWMAADGTKVVLDGIRTAIVEGLAPGQTRTLPVVVLYPEHPGHYILRLTLVQEGCAWFYGPNPASKLDIDYIVR